MSKVDIPEYILEIFIEAFSDGVGFDGTDGYGKPVEYRKCNCGQKFSNCSYMSLEGKEYMIECDCWHERAKMIIGFLDGHISKIVRYINGMKEYKRQVADSYPEVKDV